MCRQNETTQLLYTNLNVVQNLRWFVGGFGRVVKSRNEDVTADANPEKLIL
jgi:hypothetical protein